MNDNVSPIDATSDALTAVVDATAVSSIASHVKEFTAQYGV